MALDFGQLKSLLHSLLPLLIGTFVMVYELRALRLPRALVQQSQT